MKSQQNRLTTNIFITDITLEELSENELISVVGGNIVLTERLKLQGKTALAEEIKKLEAHLVDLEGQLE